MDFLLGAARTWETRENSWASLILTNPLSANGTLITTRTYLRNIASVFNVLKHYRTTIVYRINSIYYCVRFPAPDRKGPAEMACDRTLVNYSPISFCNNTVVPIYSNKHCIVPMYTLKVTVLNTMSTGPTYLKIMKMFEIFKHLKLFSVEETD